MFLNFRKILLLAFVLCLVQPASSFAQNSVDSLFEGAGEEQPQAELPPVDDPLADAMLQMNIQQSFDYRSKLSKPQTSPAELGSLFYTEWQHALLQEAKFGFLTRPPLDGELDQDGGGAKPRGLREISLGGIVYKAPMEWIVWLNGKRIAPDAIPEEVIDIKVRNTYVELKWFDAYTNRIFPIRIRPHQRFNLDSRIFLPGAAPGSNQL